MTLIPNSVLVVIILAAVGVFLLRALAGANGKRLPEYATKPSLLTKAERSFFGVLTMAAGADYRVMAKVRVADVVTPRKGLQRKAWFSAFNRISAKHFDFVLCDPSDLSVKLVVELNDRSHNRQSRMKRDEFLRHVCRSASVRLVEIDAKAKYTVEGLRQAITGNGVDSDSVDLGDGRKEPTIS